MFSEKAFASQNATLAFAPGELAQFLLSQFSMHAT